MGFGKRGRNFKNRSEGKCKAGAQRHRDSGLALHLTERRLYLPLPRFFI